MKANPRTKRRHSGFGSFLRGVTAIGVVATLTVFAVAGALYLYIRPQLPDVSVLRDFQYQVPMSVYSADGKLIAQYGEKKSSPVQIDELPQQVINAFLAAEDDRFFQHPGVDYQGLLRAAFKLLVTGEKKQGGSTITMQVARNFFLSSEKTFLRKLKEIFLAIKIDHALSKREILTLYLNKIYFGNHAYGVEAAAQVYFGKSAQALSLPEIAMLAGLPKAPSKYNPVSNPAKALSRRNWVLQRMQRLNFITREALQEAVGVPVAVHMVEQRPELDAPYIGEMVRGEMYAQYGEAAYTTGYKVYTTVDSRLQVVAATVVRNRLHDYDERHGFVPPKRNVALSKKRPPPDKQQELVQAGIVGDTEPAIVTALTDRSATFQGIGGTTAALDFDEARWARKRLPKGGVGGTPRGFKDILKIGDLIRVRRTANGTWRLTQVPETEAAMVTLNPSDGAIIALVGGFDFAHSSFNRVTQALRQPGSGFKPFLYTAALEAGFTPASIINDAPLVYYDPSQAGGEWRPKNYGGRFYGPTRLRVALAKSRNLVSVRLMREVGVEQTVKTAERFGFDSKALPPNLSLALGSGIATPLTMARAYAAFANGGFRVDPYLISRIETQDGRTLYQASPRTACLECPVNSSNNAVAATRIITPQIHYLINSMLQEVIKSGTAEQALELGRADLAGKTGTTNDQHDAWFNGYNPDFVTVCWVGYDSSRSLGDEETGGKLALPFWIDFMREALKDHPDKLFPQPSGLVTVRINPYTGLQASGGSNTIFETFLADNVPRHGVAKAPSATGDSGTAQDSAPSESSRAIESLF